ncbi:MAG: NUDIX hydrolase [Candidatus Lambdaproteobacteria bacterium]|nr:NUDIX hydrolase [Candidatus Lambdaproteobacteria bacterium]
MLPPGPRLAVDAIIERPGRGVLLIERRNPPPGWALPGGFVERGESCEDAVRREVREETGLELEQLTQFRVYSEPARDPRGHVVSVVFAAIASGEPHGGDDARAARFFPWEALPPLAFDHGKILHEYRQRQG